MQQCGPSLSWFPLASGRWGRCKGPWCTLSRVTQGILTFSNDPRQPVLAVWEAKSALQGCTIAEGENVGGIHKDGGVAPPRLAGGGCPLPVAPACRQLSCGLALWLSTGCGWQNTERSAPVMRLGKGIEQCKCLQHTSLWGDNHALNPY